MTRDSSGNVRRYDGFAAAYDTYRPAPPSTLPPMLMQLAATDRPALVIDLGCGTGLSTRLWRDRADSVIGVDPNDDMRNYAEQHTTAAHIRYQTGYGESTGLPDGCADIVTCAQSLHWMEPSATLAEIGRILRPGGVFAAYDCEWPPTLQWEVEVAYRKFIMGILIIERERGLSPSLQFWEKDQHLMRMKESRQFRYTRETCMHHVEEGDAERLVQVARSQGSVQSVLQAGWTEREIGLVKLRAVAKRAMDDHPWIWYWTYRVRIGVK